MSVEKTIISLLYRYDCVIVSDFGGFVAKKHNAVFHPVSYSFDPPRKVIGFNSDLIHSDGLLANELRKTEGITYQEAVDLIQKTVSEWNYKLAHGQSIYLEGLGKFSKTPGVIEFLPAENQNFDLNFYGFNAVKGQYILRERTIDKAPSGKTNSNWMSYAAAIAFAFIVGASGFFANNRFVQPQLSSVLPLLSTEVVTNTVHEKPIAPVIRLEEPDNPESTNEVEDINIIPQPEVEIALDDEIVLNENEQNEQDLNQVEEIDLSVKKYQVIGGSFKVYSQAMEHQAKLKREGYDRAIIIGKVGNYFMVAYDTFHDVNEAIALKRDLEKKGNDVFMRP